MHHYDTVPTAVTSHPKHFVAFRCDSLANDNKHLNSNKPLIPKIHYKITQIHTTKYLHSTMLDNFPLELLDSSVLISRTDSRGKIVYANKKFCDVSGWKKEELIGKDHKILNSGKHKRSFWEEMYYATLGEKKVWNGIVTNRTKDGKLYHVDSYIIAEFSDTGKHVGYSSIRQDITNIIKSYDDLNQKSAYLEYAAKILRHDMYSGIMTYIPRGISSLERRLPNSVIENYKLNVPLKLLKDGLKYTQRIYTGAKEFTNIVRENRDFTKIECNLQKLLLSYLISTSYSDQVVIESLPYAEVNESLFCTAIDNLIQNGLKYNDSSTKYVRVYSSNNNNIIIQDNGRGMTQEEFEYYSLPYTRKIGQLEQGTGLGLNIAVAILKEHGFRVSCEKLHDGTAIRITLHD